MPLQFAMSAGRDTPPQDSPDPMAADSSSSSSSSISSRTAAARRIATAPRDEPGANNRLSPPSSAATAAAATAWASRSKRIACSICRKRKLKCDGARPSCGTCSRLGHDCAYDEVRRKSGPKRGYVKALEERLKQVETLLRTQDPSPANTSPAMGGSTQDARLEHRPATSSPNGAAAAAAAAASQIPVFNVTNINTPFGSAGDQDAGPWQSPQLMAGNDFSFAPDLGMDPEPEFTWEMIDLGLEEPLPAAEIIDDLHQTYFAEAHHAVPMIHKSRYLAAMNLAPHQRPPISLRYAIWALACTVNERYDHYKDIFYLRARKYVEANSLRGFGEYMLAVAHAQTHVLLAIYEFRMMQLPRAWISTGCAIRMCQIFLSRMGLHRVDGAGLEVKQCLPPVRDWTEREERRRAFWMSFCLDRYASIGTGWPSGIDEKDILTHLPVSDAAFDSCQPEPTQSLAEGLKPAGIGKLSSFGGTVLMACLYGRNLTHLHRPDADNRDHDLNGEFWKRHRQIDSILLNFSLYIPAHLRLPDAICDHNAVWANLSVHTSTIGLHQAAIFKADKNRLPASFSAESKLRCIASANEITTIMKMVAHVDLSAASPFITFSLYIAARVFIQCLKSRPDDTKTADSLRFLLAAMNGLKRRNALTETFLIQLDVDLEALGAQLPKLRAVLPIRSSVFFCRLPCFIKAKDEVKSHAADAGGGGPDLPGAAVISHHNPEPTRPPDGRQPSLLEFSYTGMQDPGHGDLAEVFGGQPTTRDHPEGSGGLADATPPSSGGSSNTACLELRGSQLLTARTQLGSRITSFEASPISSNGGAIGRPIGGPGDPGGHGQDIFSDVDLLFEMDSGKSGGAILTEATLSTGQVTFSAQPNLDGHQYQYQSQGQQQGRLPDRSSSGGWAPPGEVPFGYLVNHETIGAVDDMDILDWGAAAG